MNTSKIIQTAVEAATEEVRYLSHGELQALAEDKTAPQRSLEACINAVGKEALQKLWECTEAELNQAYDIYTKAYSSDLQDCIGFAETVRRQNAELNPVDPVVCQGATMVNWGDEYIES